MKENHVQRMKCFGIIATCVTALSVLSAQTSTNPSVSGNTNPNNPGIISPAPSIPNPRASITPLPSPVVTPTATPPPR